jgi:hypothetical protein
VPLQNRVDPWGRLHAVEARGAWMGNRGVAPARYSELFFLDEARLDTLPDGVMIERDGLALLIGGEALHPWSFTGYAAALPKPSGATRVRVLTPRSVVRAIAEGLVPQIHPSAGACRTG